MDADSSDSHFLRRSLRLQAEVGHGEGLNRVEMEGKQHDWIDTVVDALGEEEANAGYDLYFSVLSTSRSSRNVCRHRRKENLRRELR